MGSDCGRGNSGKVLRWVVPNLLLGVVVLSSCSSTTTSQGTETIGAGGTSTTGGADTSTGGGQSVTTTGNGGTAGSNTGSVGGTTTTGDAGAAGGPPDGTGCIETTTRSCAAAPFNRVGACATDTAVCEGGEWVGCPESHGDDSCEAGNDNNCNGTPNEECPCVDGDVQACGHAAVGVCKPGTSSCVDSEWEPCVGNIDPGERDCASADDNDCDGSPDNTLDEACQCEVGEQQACEEHPGNDGKGPCRAGSQTCTLGADKTTSDWGDCSGSVGPKTDDTCDEGNDDNCNDKLNEDCPCVNGDTQPCGHATVGICKRGTSTCENKEWQPCEGNIEPETRDCSSPLDNDCDGIDDDTKDSVCECAVGGMQTCGAHPGLDGKGPCKAGSQSCVVAADKTSSHWGGCSGSVGPAGADTCNPDNDNNCNGEINEDCSCVNGTPINCECGGTVTCTNGMIPSCAQVPVLRYRDSDDDTFGNPNNSSMVCPGTSGWVSNSNDCNDSDDSVYPNNAVVCAADQMTREWCPSTGGVLNSEYCDQGCWEGDCRSDGTIGVPGFVSCRQDTPPLTYCTTSAGCDAYETTCGTSGSRGTVQCDGPNDCPGQICCAWPGSFSQHAECLDACTPTDARRVCDPLDGDCACTPFGSGEDVGYYVCPEGV